MQNQERSLFEKPITSEEIEKKLRELDQFIQNKKDESENNPDENRRDTKKLYDAAQEVIEALKKLSQSTQKEQTVEKGQEGEEKDEKESKQDFGRVKETIKKVLSSLENFVDEEKKEKEKEEEKQKEEEQKKKQNSSHEHDSPEKKKQEEQEEQERKRKLEREEEEQKKEKEEKKLKKSLEETRQVIEEILEHERKMQKEAYEKEGSKDLGEKTIQALESSLPPLNKALGNVSSKQTFHAISGDNKDLQKENVGVSDKQFGKENDKFKEVVSQLKGIFGKLGMEGAENGNVRSPEKHGEEKDKGGRGQE